MGGRGTDVAREEADIVLAPRSNDYHPEHRYTGILVQDAAYMVVVPNTVAAASTCAASTMGIALSEPRIHSPMKDASSGWKKAARSMVTNSRAQPCSASDCQTSTS